MKEKVAGLEIFPSTFPFIFLSFSYEKDEGKSCRKKLTCFSKNTSTLFPSTFPSTFPCSRHPPPASYQSRHLHPLRPARLRPEPECQARRSTLDGERADLRTDKVFQKARSSCAAPPDSALAATSDLPDGATPETVTDSFPSASPPSCDYCGLTIPGRRGRRGMQTGSRQRQAGTGQQEACGQRTEDR